MGLKSFVSTPFMLAMLWVAWSAALLASCKFIPTLTGAGAATGTPAEVPPKLMLSAPTTCSAAMVIFPAEPMPASPALTRTLWSNQIDVSRHHILVRKQYTDAATDHRLRYVHIESTRLRVYHQQRRRSRRCRLRSLARIDIAVGRPHQNVAALQGEHARLVDREIIVDEGIHIPALDGDDAQLRRVFSPMQAPVRR